MVLSGLDPRRLRRTPTKRELREAKSQNRRASKDKINNEGGNIQDRINRLRMKFDEIQPKADTNPTPTKYQGHSSSYHPPRDEERNEERTAEIKRRIDEMKNRLGRN